MNDRFLRLEPEKRQRILRAAYRVFSQNSYKKAPMSAIAYEGGVSKALLFHYFENKKELYLYLWANAMQMTRSAITEYRVLETADFFEMLRRSLYAKCALMRRAPYLYAFSLRAYYETEPEIKRAVQASFSDASESGKRMVFEKMDFAGFRKDIDLHAMYNEIFYAIDGYMLRKHRSGRVIPDEIEREIAALIALWKTVYAEGE